MVRRTLRLIVQLLLLVLALSCKPGCSYCDSSQNSCYSCSDASAKLMADGSCSKPPKLVDNCLVYNTDSSCNRCGMTYQLKGGACSKDETGCIRYSSNGGCTECGFGTRLTGGVCTGIVGCKQYSADNTNCDTCFDGLLAVGPACMVLEACQVTLANNGCGGCSEGYLLSGFVCIHAENPIVPGCAVMTTMQTCQYC